MTTHTPVLFTEVIESLAPTQGKIYVDGTLGGGGHTQALLNAGAKVVGFDKDPKALERVPNHPNLTKLNSNFVHMREALATLNISTVNGILLDLGYSSDQMDDATRGFSYQQNGPLDMRMNQTLTTTAADILNTMPETQLANILWEYGEEPKSRPLARKIVGQRKTSPFETTAQLLKVIEEIYPPHKGLSRSHPAARTFQALRVEVNGELDDIRTAIPTAASLLEQGGRLAIITFNGIEDRIVKQFYRNLAAETLDNVGRTIQKSPFKIWKKIEPTEAEIESNRRSRSAKVRVLERIF